MSPPEALTAKSLLVVSGHQPAYLPWLGLLHKASLSDVFVYMDDVKFINRGFIHRNRIKVGPGADTLLTVPLDRQHSASDRIKDIRIATDPPNRDWQEHHYKTIQIAYTNAPYFKAHKSFLQHLYFERRWEFLADLNLYILKYFFQCFGLSPRLIIGSEQMFSGVKSDLVLEHATRYGASVVIAGTLGREYISTNDFEGQGIRVVFQEYKCCEYPQRFPSFIPRLSALDLLLNHGPGSADIMRAKNVTREEICL